LTVLERGQIAGPAGLRGCHAMRSAIHRRSRRPTRPCLAGSSSWLRRAGVSATGACATCWIWSSPR